MLTKPSLTLKRRIKAPPEKVYAAWTRPEQIALWFGPIRPRPCMLSQTRASADAIGSASALRMVRNMT